MFNMTGSEIIVILLLALVILGPEKLPDAVRKFGRTYAEFKKVSTGFQSEFKAALEEPMREMRDTADMLGRTADFSADAPIDHPMRTATADPPQPALQPTDDIPFGEAPDPAPQDPPDDGTRDDPRDRPRDDERDDSPDDADRP